MFTLGYGNAATKSLYRFCVGHMFSVLLGTYVGMELMSHVIALCLIILGTASLIIITSKL